MASSGYVADTFVAGEQPTTSKWNELWGNDAAFNSGTGFNDGIIVSRHFATSGLQLPDKTYNPYKFSVYRAAALTSNTTNTAVPFDTKVFDTGNNVDVVTHQGRFTAPIAGFYWFVAGVGNSAATNTVMAISFFKNGTVIQYGNVLNPSNGNSKEVITGLFQLAANDYIEVGFIGGGGATVTVGQADCYFQGTLWSAT